MAWPYHGYRMHIRGYISARRAGHTGERGEDRVDDLKQFDRRVPYLPTRTRLILPSILRISLRDRALERERIPSPGKVERSGG